LVKKPTINQTDLQPGDMVSVDQIVSPIPGLVAQITGTLTTKMYNYATIYVDQATRLGCAPAEGSNSRRNVRSKEVFEACASSQGVAIKAYHADNGIFHAHKWVDCCRVAKHGLT
jgi:hypothetical protein